MHEPCRVATMLAPHAEFFRNRAPDVDYSARILYQELVGQRGFPGKFDTVKIFVRPLRALRDAAQLTMTRFEDAAGTAEPDRLGADTGAFSDSASRAALLRPHLGFLRAAVSIWPVPTSGSRVCSRPTSGPSSTSAAIPKSTSTTGRGPSVPAVRGQGALEPYLQGLRRLLGLRAAAVRPVPGSNQGQG